MDIIFYDRDQVVVDYFKYNYEQILEKDLKDSHKPFNFKFVKAWFNELKHSSGSVFVAPGNSFGFMDGGLDLAIDTKFNCKKMVVNIIKDFEHGELPVGGCIQYTYCDNFIGFRERKPLGL